MQKNTLKWGKKYPKVSNAKVLMQKTLKKISICFIWYGRYILWCMNETAEDFIEKLIWIK